MKNSVVPFLHCPRCQSTTRILPVTGDDTESVFRHEHRTCPLEEWVPTGRSTSTGAWSDPLSTRRIEVNGPRGRGLAVGERTLLDEPMTWRIETPAPGERRDVELDRALYWTIVDKALFPGHLPKRSLDEWALQIEHFARSAPRSDIILLEDEPGSGSTTLACLTLTARSRLEAALQAFGFDEETESRLAVLFDDELFPPLRVKRRWSKSLDAGNPPESVASPSP